MTQRAKIDRVVLRHYRSIAACDVRLGPLTWLVGRNGAGKSNFLDALHLVKDALTGSLESALNERGGLDSVRQRSGGHPKHFTVRLEFTLGDRRRGFYSFEVGSLKGGRHFVNRERFGLPGKGQGPYFEIRRGRIVESSEETVPALSDDRLGLVVMAGLKAFKPVYDMLIGMSFYNLNPKRMRELQKPGDGRLLKSEGENIASVLRHVMGVSPEAYQTVQKYLRTIAPMMQNVTRKAVSHMETLEFQQEVQKAERPWKFEARSMSDGTLRALGVLTALFQEPDGSPPSLVGIEEPETALHPAAAAALREAIRFSTRTRQIVLTSHSADLLDADDMDPQELHAVVWDHGNTRIVPIREAAAEAMRKHFYSAGELLRDEQLTPEIEELPELHLNAGDLFNSLQ